MEILSERDRRRYRNLAMATVRKRDELLKVGTWEEMPHWDATSVGVLLERSRSTCVSLETY